MVRFDRAKAARYGFSKGDINAVVQAAIGGQEVARVYEGEINSALTVRLAARYRDNVDAIRAIPIALVISEIARQADRWSPCNEWDELEALDDSTGPVMPVATTPDARNEKIRVRS